MKWIILVLFILAGCNSKEASLTAIQGMSEAPDLAPYISSASPVDNPGTFVPGDALEFEVNFSEPVAVTGNPTLRVLMSTGTYEAVLTGVTATRLVFTLPIIASQFDGDGVGLVGPLLLNGGSIRDGAQTTDALLTFTAPNTSAYLVNAIIPLITSVSPPVQNTYNLAPGNNAITFKLNYSVPVTVDTTGGTPKILMNVAGASHYAFYTSGSGTNEHIYQLPVPVGRQGVVSIAGSFVETNGGSIRDQYNQDASTALAASDFTGVLIDSLGPTPLTLTASADKTYYTGESILIVANFDSPVKLNGGAPSLQLTLNTGGTLAATYDSISADNTKITFRYQVQLGHLDLDGIAITAAIQNGTTITDLFDNPLVTSSIIAPSTAGVLVDGVRPTITSITTTTANGLYGASSSLTFRIRFSENITVAGGFPRITILIGALSVNSADCGSFTNYLDCAVTIPNGAIDMNGVDVTAMSLNGATIRDGGSGSNNADLTMSLTNFPGLLVDGVPPTIQGFNYITPAGARSGSGTKIQFELDYSEAIIVTGLPSINLSIDGTPQSAVYVSSAGDKVKFEYTIGTAYNFSGITHSGDVSLNGGTITDSTGNPASLSLSGLDLGRYAIVPPTLRYWFDPNDTLTTTTTTGKPSTFKSKTQNALSSTLIGTPVLQLLNSKRYLDLPSELDSVTLDPITGTIRTIVIIARASNYGALINDMMGVPGFNFQISLETGLPAYMGLNCHNSCYFYNSFGVRDDAESDGFAFNYVLDQPYIFFIEIENGITNPQLVLGYDGFKGSFGDIMLLTEIPDLTLRSKIHSYVTTKYTGIGLNYPPSN